MRITHTFKTSVTSIRTHMGRSLLTVLGIVIAISAIVFIASIGRGAEALILNEVSGLGAETIVIRPGKEPSGPTDIIDTIFADSITDRDVVALKKSHKLEQIS